MISCTEFIYSYSELFKFIEKREGEQGVKTYWEHISDNYVAPRLGECVHADGIEGCYKYWAKALSEEAADFTMTLDNDIFVIDMHHCPSKGRLLDKKNMEPYHNYCGHCDLLYRRVLEPLGLKYDYDMSGTANAQCKLTISKK
ncbi:MAG: hypothetical protein DBX47_01325 [Clostridiales bacterium]|nr:MAG: hypothetical protein DBX47_01325 [Clostridiales bacterium]